MVAIANELELTGQASQAMGWPGSAGQLQQYVEAPVTLLAWFRSNSQRLDGSSGISYQISDSDTHQPVRVVISYVGFLVLLSLFCFIGLMI
jgi:hypothetical protein